MTIPKTTNGKEGVDTNDQPVENVAEILKKQGWGIGVASSVTIDHATPGSFYAHVSSRSDYYTIGTQLASADYDFVAGASFSKPFNSTQSTGEDLFTLCEKNVPNGSSVIGAPIPSVRPVFSV